MQYGVTPDAYNDDAYRSLSWLVSPLIMGQWFKEDDLKTILNGFGVSIYLS